MCGMEKQELYTKPYKLYCYQYQSIYEHYYVNKGHGFTFIEN
jgi:hypothetical protein